MPKRKINGERLLENIVSDFQHQRPALTKKQAGELEAAVLEHSASTRRVAFASLTTSGKRLIKEIAGKRVDQSVAIGNMKVAHELRAYAERLRAFAVLMDSASTRISLAARWRDDYESIADAARNRDASSSASANA